jgi:hypothetical protein
VISKENTEADAGIWIPGHEYLDGESDSENEEEAAPGVHEDDGSESSSGEGEEGEGFPEGGPGRFDALQINDGESEEESEEDEEL